MNASTDPSVDPSPDPSPGQADRIDLADPAASTAWAERLDVTSEQLREAIAAVGDRAADVEMHLKGSRSTTNADRVEQVEKSGPSGGNGTRDPG